MTDAGTAHRRELIAATRNPDKLPLLAHVAGDRFRVAPLPAGVDIVEPDLGDGTDLRPNAAAQLSAIAADKAVAASVALAGRTVIASDGGLFIPALGAAWQPAWTRRFAGPGATNADRVAALLALTSDLTGEERRVSWREAVAVARDGQLLLTAAAESAPGWLAAPSDPRAMANTSDPDQGFWLPGLWRAAPGPGAPLGRASGHWDRLALLVGPLLAGLSGDLPRRLASAGTGDRGPEPGATTR